MERMCHKKNEKDKIHVIGHLVMSTAKHANIYYEDKFGRCKKILLILRL